jgi:IS5 family transposase
MYRHSEKQLQFLDFKLPFSGKLRSDNRWVKLAELIPWQEIENLYTSSLSGNSKGAPAFSVRVAFGALLIKEKLGLSDEETVEQIRENPYLQYFLGLEQYEDKVHFHPTMFVHFRKRFPEDITKQINELIAMKAIATTHEEPEKHPDEGDDNPSGSGTANKGKLLVDATCAPEDINYPTDLKLLNKAREQSEQIIDTLHKAMPKGTKKPRTYRQNARKNFLKVSKSRKVRRKTLRKAIRQQLGYLWRNLRSIEKQCQIASLSELSKRQYMALLVISELYRQQRWMYDHKSRRIDDRIVSINKPHVRPIKRGKAGSDTEFGAKISASVVDGFTFVDRISWDNFNESRDLIDQIEAYKSRFGFYPESAHADKIYRTRYNLRYCKKHGIRLLGPKLGRPPKQTEQNKARIAAAKKLAHQDEIDRIAIEGRFGLGKRRYGLGRIMTKLGSTSKTAIIMSFLVINLERWLRAIFLGLFHALHLLLRTRSSGLFLCTRTEKGAIALILHPAFMRGF